MNTLTMKSQRRSGKEARERSRSRSAPPRRKESEAGKSRHEGQRGVSLQVLDNVPVVSLESESPFYEHASWLLQTSLQSTAKADSLYEFVEDRDVIKKFTRELNLSADEMSIVRIKDPEFQDVMAIGTNGKRSVMLAIVIAILLRPKKTMITSVWKELKAIGLDETFVELVNSGKPIQSKSTKSRGQANRNGDRAGGAPEPRSRAAEEDADDRGKSWAWQDRSKDGTKDRSGGGSTSSSWKASAWEGDDWSWKDEAGDDGADDKALEGVELRMIMRNIPVVDLEASSVFHENISWLLQTAFEVSGKADGTFEYHDDRAILDECRRSLGMTAQETGTARCKRKDLQHVMAVGTCGKRSTMLAILVAYALHQEDNLNHMRQDVVTFDAKLGKAFDALMRKAADLAGVRLAWPDARGGGRRRPAGSGEDSYSSKPGTRPVASSWVAPSIKKGGGGLPPRGGVKAKKAVKDNVAVGDLDAELAGYFEDDD